MLCQSQEPLLGVCAQEPAREVAGISEQGRCGDIEAIGNLQEGKEYKNIGARRHGSHSGLQGRTEQERGRTSMVGCRVLQHTHTRALLR